MLPSVIFFGVLTDGISQGGSEDGFFVDPDVYTLWMVLDTSDDLDLPRNMRQSPRLILEQYTGDPDCLNAPEWTQ